jgi:hypothetical protein
MKSGIAKSANFSEPLNLHMQKKHGSSIFKIASVANWPIVRPRNSTQVQEMLYFFYSQITGARIFFLSWANLR